MLKPHPCEKDVRADKFHLHIPQRSEPIFILSIPADVCERDAAILGSNVQS